MVFKNRLYEDITPERFSVLRSRFDQFLINLDKDEPVIRVYDPLRKDQLDKLAVIREAGIQLQQKKDEDILKAKQAAEEASKAEAEKKESPEEQPEETKEEENTTETEKKDAN